MDVKEFFELSAGKWFSQKTSHHLTLKQSEQGKSDLTIDILPSDDPQLIKLCQQAGIDGSQTELCAKYTWKGTSQWDAQSLNTANQQGDAIVILIPATPGAKTGKLYRFSASTTELAIAHYTLGDDDAFNLVTTDEHQSSEERVWFESNNVRLKTTIVTHVSGDAIASFYSEIRLMGK